MRFAFGAESATTKAVSTLRFATAVQMAHLFREHPVAEWLSGLRRQSVSVDAAFVVANPVSKLSDTDRKDQG